jgi:hypothetical protein
MLKDKVLDALRAAAARQEEAKQLRATLAEKQHALQVQTICIMQKNVQ